MEEERSKCKDCGRDLDRKKHEWFYCPECWEKRLAGPSVPVSNKSEVAGDSAEGLLKLIEALGGGKVEGNETPDIFMLDNSPYFAGDKFWFETPLIKASIQGRRPRKIKEWIKFLWNIDFFIERWPLGKTIILIIILLSLLF